MKYDNINRGGTWEDGETSNGGLTFREQVQEELRNCVRGCTDVDRIELRPLQHRLILERISGCQFSITAADEWKSSEEERKGRNPEAGGSQV